VEDHLHEGKERFIHHWHHQPVYNEALQTLAAVSMLASSMCQRSRVTAATLTMDDRGDECRQHQADYSTPEI
jgi:hypothetical protein